MKIPTQKSLFTIPDNISYLNCAYMSPLLKGSADAGVNAIQQRNEPWTYKVKDWFEPAEDLKQLFAAIINANKQNIALIPSVSYGIAVAKNNIHLKTGQEIVLLDQQYPSNVYAWQELAKESGAKIMTVKKNVDQSWTDAILPVINKNTGLVAIPNCHWTNGGLLDLKIISAKVKDVNAKLVIDASQSAGVYPIDVQNIKPDFLVTAGYKWLLGPYGLSYLYADEKYFEDGKPIEYTWMGKKGSEDFAALVDYRDEYKPGAARFDAGQYPAFINIPMATAALKQILEWGIDNIQETLSELTSHIAALATQRGLKIADSNRIGHLIGINLEENRIREISTTLSVNNVYISFRGSSMRIAPYLYNQREDIENLFRLL